MQPINAKWVIRVGLCMLLLTAVVFGSAAQAADRIPRILFVGDSWTGFMWGFRSLKVALENDPDPGMHRWIETGSSTAIMGAKAFEFLWPERLQAVADSLAMYPNIDVVVMTLGGNDFSGGFPVPGRGDDVSYYDWFRDNTDGNPDNDWSDTELFDTLKSDMREILRNILVQRPDIRVAIVGYDWMCRKCYDKVPGLTIALQNQGILRMELAKRELAMEPEFSGRVEYIQSLGIMQYNYGYFTSNEWGDTGVKPWPPKRSLSEVDVPPHSVQLPGTLANGYSPWPGGDQEHQDPRACYIDDDIHLQREGYDLIAKHAFDVRVREWLNYPKVLSIIPQSRVGNTQSYTVTFSEPVTGVDLSDFELLVAGKGLAKAAAITDVQAGSDASQWTVAASLGDVTGDVLLRVLDDDSITRIDNGTPLGGADAGNGRFEYNGTYYFRDMLRPEDSDFIGALNYLDIASQPYFATYVPGLSFSPDRFDANGAFLTDGGSLSQPYKIPGNTILESYEFALINHMINHPRLDLSSRGGARAAEVIHAWENNIHEMQITLGGSGSISDVLLPGMDSMLAGYMTLGDSDSSFLTITLITMLNAVDNFPVDVGTMNPAAYIGLPTVLGASADPDGDGWTNAQEFAYALPDGPDGYAAAALDPNLIPKRGDGLYGSGDSVRIPLLLPTPQPTDPHLAWDGTIQWKHNGQPLTDDAHISGSNGQCLVIDPADVDDAGSYTCTYHVAPPPGTPRVLTERTYGPVLVRVGERVPVAAPLGLAVLAAAAGMGGVSALRRRRR